MKNVTKFLLIGSLVLSTGTLTACNKTQTKSSESSTTKVSSSTAVSSTTEQSSTASTEAEATKKMDLAQIKSGDFSSLLGDWQIVAVSLNRHDGTGDSWIDPRGDQLTVTETQLTSGNMTLSGNVLNDGEDKSIVYSEKDGHLQADTQEGSIIWNLSFYPENVAMTGWGDLPAAIDQTKERLVIRTSNNNYVQVFQRQDATDETVSSSAEVEAEAPATTMDQAQIKTGDYSSITGTWQNGRGATIVVTSDTMEFSDISGHDWPAKLTGLTLDIPSQNSPDGTPQQVNSLAGTTEAYKPQVRVAESDGYTSMISSIPQAVISVAFLPSGVMGDLQSGAVDQEKIIAIGTQNTPTAVPEDVVYYKVK